MLLVFRQKRVLIDLNGQVRHSIDIRYTCRLCFPISFGKVVLCIDSIKRYTECIEDVFSGYVMNLLSGMHKCR